MVLDHLEGLGASMHALAELIDGLLLCSGGCGGEPTLVVVVGVECCSCAKVIKLFTIHIQLVCDTHRLALGVVVPLSIDED